MSFSMTNVKIKSKTKFNPREYYSYVYNNPLLTDNVRYALKRYMDFRLSKRCLGLSIQKQKDMINATKKLYNDDLDIQDFQVNEFTKPPKRLTQRITTDQEIKDYFGDIEI